MGVEIERASLVALAADLLRLRSVNPPGDERPVADLLSHRLEAAGLEVQRVDHGRERASLVARLRGGGGRGALVLSGHLDVVGEGERPWAHGPFDAEIVDDRLYGRGAADMKGAVAAMAAAAIALARGGATLEGDLVLAFTAGEETDSMGARAIVDRGLLHGADAIVIGEPTALNVYVAEKGNLTVEARTTGIGAHSSMPQLGRNAIVAMADVIRALEAHRFAIAPHAVLGEPTMAICTIRGGTASNVIPDHCAIEVDVRTVPGQTRDGLLAELRDALAGLDVRLEKPLWREAVETDPDAPLVRELCTTVADVTGRRPTIGGVGYATDGSEIVPSLRIPMAICGPGLAEQAHQTDEWVSITALHHAARIYAELANRRLSAP